MESLFEKLFYSARWILAPLFLGLSLALLALALKFFQEVWHVLPHVFELSESDLILSLLSMVDMGLVGGLIVMVMYSSYARMEGELDVTEPKTKNSVRKVALSQQAVDLLVQEHEQHPDNPILFPSPRTGGYWSPDAVSRINRKLLKNAGIEEHVRFHDLRHTFATMAISSGVDVKTLSSMLGHYSAGFTLDTYTHITNDMQRGAAEKIGGFMESVTSTTTPEPPDPPEESRCKVIPFGKVG